jgi:hypothetical protein
MRGARKRSSGFQCRESTRCEYNAKRYARTIINQSDRLATLLTSSASDDAILNQLDMMKQTVLQLDAAKRKLKSRYPGNDQLINTLTYVRTTYFYLEDLLLPVEE